VAEKIWPEVRAKLSWPATGSRNHYGQFCFGCIAPDVDKASAMLTQKNTHFYDRTTDYDLMASHRSAAFLKHQAGFLGQPFADLHAEAQAFVLGYLCHLCVDEVSKHMWRREVWVQLKRVHPGATFAAIDEAAWQRIKNYPVIAQAQGFQRNGAAAGKGVEHTGRAPYCLRLPGSVSYFIYQGGGCGVCGRWR
jgi:hypothetical protein